MPKRRVVVSGIGAVCPLGNSAAASWEAACAGRSGITRITRFDASDFSSQIAGEVKGFDPLQTMEPREVRKLDLFCQYAIAAGREAWDDAGLAETDYKPESMGCVLGVGLGGLGTLEMSHSLYMGSGPRKITPFLIPMMISNLAPGHLGIRFGLKGVNFSIASACASATHAVGEAYRMIADARQEVVLTGGSESTVTAMAVGGFASMKALSSRNAEPERASRPFDRDRDGFILSEGAAILVLEEYESALRRGAKIYAEICGYGVSCDANHITAPSPDGAGAVLCMRSALADAGLKAEDIGYVNAHGTSTPLGDIAEVLAVKQLFGPYAREGLLVSSTKSVTGHMLGAAGAIEALFCALALQRGVIPPTMNLENPDEECDLDFVPDTARSCQVAYAMSNSFGFGGTNATLILGRVA